jgi:tetratricopeptide (TPR) repeat protein
VSKHLFGFFVVLIVAGCSMSRTHKSKADYATESHTASPAQNTTNKFLVTHKSISNNAPVAKAAATNSVESADAVEKEYEKLMEDDDAAQAEVDQWIQDNGKFASQGAGLSPPEMKRKIQARFEPIKQAYEDFLRRHPNHAKARIAYGSFLGDLNDEDGSQEQLEKVLEIETNSPAVYNNLANIYGHHGPVKRAFEFYAKAIDLNPNEPVYYHNFGTTVFLFRKDAKEYYGIEEQEVFDKALVLYSNAMRLDPTNFPLASDVAQTYYGIKPTRVEDALNAWTNALKLASDELEREGVYVHFARIKLHAGRFDEARGHLGAITNEHYAALKQRLTKNIVELEAAAKATNAAPTGAQ